MFWFLRTCLKSIRKGLLCKKIYCKRNLFLLWLLSFNMASFNTFSDASNTSVRAFLTKVGAFYNDNKKFDTTSGKGKQIWETIKTDFNHTCCYCGKKSDSLTMEHLIMINRTEFGLHHPGNVVPCCRTCNKRIRNKDKSFANWETHLKHIARENFKVRFNKIKTHMDKYKYPDLTDEEIKTIKVIAESLYKNISTEGEKAYSLYLNLREEFL
jgi:5-methylcytosine-specific restriction endonuclease McrA